MKIVHCTLHHLWSHSHCSNGTTTAFQLLARRSPSTRVLARKPAAEKFAAAWQVRRCSLLADVLGNEQVTWTQVIAHMAGGQGGGSSMPIAIVRVTSSLSYLLCPVSMCITAIRAAGTAMLRGHSYRSGQHFASANCGNWKVVVGRPHLQPCWC